MRCNSRSNRWLMWLSAGAVVVGVGVLVLRPLMLGAQSRARQMRDHAAAHGREQGQPAQPPLDSAAAGRRSDAPQKPPASPATAPTAVPATPPNKPTDKAKPATADDRYLELVDDAHARDERLAPKPKPKPMPPPAPLNPRLAHAVQSINAEQIMQHVLVLADASMEGRAAGAGGARRAAAYIAEQFRQIGVTPAGQTGTYYQDFHIRIGHQITGEMELKIDDETDVAFGLKDDYMPVVLPADKADVVARCAMVGYGITSAALGFDEYAGIDVKGRAVLVFAGAPWTIETAGWVRRVDKRPLDSLLYKAKNAAEHGAALLLVVENPIGWRAWVNPKEHLRPPDREFPIASPIPVVHLTRRTAAEMANVSEDDLRLAAIDIARDRRPGSRLLDDRTLHYRAAITGTARIGRNIIAILPGRDPDLRDEAVVIGAHYDHLGKSARGTFYGANDNASGVGAVLEVAQAFAAMPEPPRRSILFIAFAAEEIGRLGSSHYTNRPTVAMDQTVLMINFDMIGRNEPNHAYAVGTRSSHELHQIHQQMNAYVGLRLTHPEQYRLGLSDHTAFYRANVPIMYLFAGRHSGYHSPDDTPDLLVKQKMQSIAKLAFLTAWTVAERSDRLTFDGFRGE